MNIRFLSRQLMLFVALNLSAAIPAAFAADEAQLDAIKVLGQLNGVALHCNALAQTQRMKRALVLNLPKRRQLGELFEYETNKSFMAFIKEEAQCPSPASLSQQIDKAVERLEAVYARQ